MLASLSRLQRGYNVRRMMLAMVVLGAAKVMVEEKERRRVIRRYERVSKAKGKEGGGRTRNKDGEGKM